MPLESTASLDEAIQRGAELIRALRVMFPHRCMSPTQTEAQARHYAAQVELVDALWEALRDHEEEASAPLRD